VPAPGASAIHIDAPAFLVSGHAHRVSDDIVVFGLVSWVDNGIPRNVAGQIQSADSEGVMVLLPVSDAKANPANKAPKPAPEPTPSARAAEAAPAAPTPAPIEPSPIPPPTEPSWSDAVTASAPAEKAAPSTRPTPRTSGRLDPEGLPQFERGDIVVHPRYGRCTVIRAPKFHKLKLRRTTGAFFDLHLKVCSFEVEADDDGHAVYRVQIVGRNESN